MREAIGGAWLFQIVILLLLIFTAYFCLSINYTAAYKVNDSVINTIQKDEGVNPDNIKAALQEAHYTATGKCDEGWKAMSFAGSAMNQNGDANYCLKKIKVSSKSTELPDIYYYRVKTFYNINVPIISSFNFNVKGDTANIYGAKDKNIIIKAVNEKGEES